MKETSSLSEFSRLFEFTRLYSNRDGLSSAQRIPIKVTLVRTTLKVLIMFDLFDGTHKTTRSCLYFNR